jgi:integrase
MTLTAERNMLPFPHQTGGVLCMKGGIYSEQRCPICGGKFVDNHINGLVCSEHKAIHASRFSVIFGKIHKRTKSYDAAFRLLNGFRFKTDEQTYDERDYKRDNPLGFINMSEKFLEYAKPKTAHNMRPHIRHAQSYFKNRNVKDLKCGDFEDFLKTLTLSDKTKNNIIGTLKVFYRWMKRRQEIFDFPEFPVVEYQLGYRKTVDKETQHAIIDELKRIAPVKVYLGIKWLATYISIRPAEMIGLKESNIDLGNGRLYFPTPKERHFKDVPILPEDVSIFKDFTFSDFAATPFFRHDGGLQGTKKDQPYGLKYFYKWWVKACGNLEIEGVDLYGGTRHSSVRALRRYHSPEEIKEAAMSKTNKAFERYMGQANDDDILSIYRKSAKVIPINETGKELVTLFEGQKNAK